MSSTTGATYSLDKLFLFPVFQTREDFATRTGQEAPDFDPSRAPKYWFDPEAEKSTFRTVVYPTVVAYAEHGGLLLNEAGQPQLEAIVLSKKEAGTVNIPPNITNYPGAAVPSIPAPIRALEANEELTLGFGGIVLVRNKTVAAAQQEGFTPKDRDILYQIARRLNVTITE